MSCLHNSGQLIFVGGYVNHWLYNLAENDASFFKTLGCYTKGNRFS